MTILDLIKKACKTKGVDAKYAARIEKSLKVTKSEDVESSVDKFKEDFLPAIQEAEEAARKTAIEETEKTASERALKEFREKHGLDENGKPISNNEPDADTPKWFLEYKKQQEKEFEELKGTIKTNQTNAATAEKKASAEKLIGASTSGLPKTWIDRVKLDSDTSIEDQVKALEDEYTEIQQAAITQKVESGEFSPGFQEPKERSEEEWAKIMNDTEESSDPGVVDLGVN